SRPRAKTDTSRCGASVAPPGAGNGAGFSVTISQAPLASVRQRPKPRNDAGSARTASGPGDAAPDDPSGGSADLPSAGGNRPSGPACHVSISPSPTGSPRPSSSRPPMRTAPGVAGSTTDGPSGQA